MSRPHAPRIHEHYQGWEQYQTLSQPQLYLLTYENQLVTLKRLNTLTGRAHYPNTTVTSQKTMENLVAKLNAQYNTRDYGYRTVT